ncbi:hypothetical protein [Vreelandella lionensis]|nr:hypothetical protein [Halomonas lionensis]
MKEILHRLPMRFKFALVLVLPLIALGWFAAQWCHCPAGSG